MAKDYPPAPALPVNKVLTLHHNEMLIGTISKVWADQPWLNGEIELTPAFEKYREMFSRKVSDEHSDEDKQGDTNEYDPDDLENWEIADEEGVFYEVWVFVDADKKTVSWRW